MTTNLRAYHRSNNLGMGATTNLHIDSGWSKTNKNFGGVIEALRREHQWGNTDTGRTDSPPTAAAAAAAAAAITASYFYDGSDPDFGRRE